MTNWKGLEGSCHDVIEVISQYLERQRKTVENFGLYTGALAEFSAEHFPK
jgi:hypothetical protein